MKLQYKIKEKTAQDGRVLPKKEVNIRVATYIKDYDGPDEVHMYQLGRNLVKEVLTSS